MEEEKNTVSIKQPLLRKPQQKRITIAHTGKIKPLTKDWMPPFI